MNIPLIPSHPIHCIVDYEQEYDDDMEAQQATVVPSPGNLSERGPGGRHPKLKIMSAGAAVPPTNAPPRSLLEAAIGRPKTQRGEEIDHHPHRYSNDGANSTAIDIHDSREGGGGGGGGGYANNAPPLANKLSIDEIV